VRYNGSSVIDLTWVSADIVRLISDWRVLSDEESLSDHRCIVFRIGNTYNDCMFRRAHHTRWNTKSLDKELFGEILTWLLEGGFLAKSVEGLSLHIAGLVSMACDISAKRLKFFKKKRGVYWWCEEVAQARRRCIAARRLLTRRKKRGGQCEDLVELYKKSRTAFCKRIKRAKSDAWDALIKTLDDDPWGLPYRIAMNRLRRSGTALSETLEPRVVERLLDELFPAGEVHDPEEIWTNRQIDDLNCSVDVEEVIEAIRGRKRTGCPTPGPDGISLVVWKSVPRSVLECLALLYTRCLQTGKIPRSWKRAILVLIPKGNLDVNNPKARPICLLDDIGKLFERILHTRLRAHMNTLPQLSFPSRCLVSGMQFGFREGLSTIDALDSVTKHIRDKIREGKVVIAVSLDIRNALNSLSWGAIRAALERKRYPDYLRRVLDFYLSDRWVEYPICTGELRLKKVERGVPQGSVLGPFLWNIAYESVLRSQYYRLPGCKVIGYADDTLVMCAANTVEVAQYNINYYMVYLLRRIESLSLEVAPEKTEAILFHGQKRLDFTNPLIQVKGTFVRVSPHIKYLGVMLDARLNFRHHFKYVDSKIGKITRALGCLMPNLRGPLERKRRLYAGIIESVVLYAAPIWSESLNIEARRLFRRWQRAIAVRVCAAYRSVSFDSATLLA